MARGGSRVAFSHLMKKGMDEESATRHGGKASGFRERQEVLVPVENRIGKRDFRLLPGWAAPHETLPGPHCRLRCHDAVFYKDPSRIDPVFPFRPFGMGIAEREIIQDGTALTFRRHSTKIVESLIQGFTIISYPGCAGYWIFERKRGVVAIGIPEWMLPELGDLADLPDLPVLLTP